MRNDVLQNYLDQFLNVWLIILTTWNFKMPAKLQYLDHQIVTSCIAIVKVVFLLFIWKEMAWKIPNLENLEFYTCTLWDHNAKFLIMVYRWNSWVLKDCILVGINETKWTTLYCMRNDVLQNYLGQFLKCLADNFDNLKFQDASKVAIFRPPNSYILHCHGKCGLFTLYLKGNDMKNSKFGKSWILYMYTVGPQCKFLIMVYRRNSWVPNDCILVGINETKWTTFDFMRNDVLQNYLDQFLKSLADNFDNLKFQVARKVGIFRPPNSYILHCHGKCGHFTLYLKGNDMKNSKFGKSWILYMYTMGPQYKIFNYGLQEELMGAKWLHSGRKKWNSVNHLWIHQKWCATKLFRSIFEMFGW